MKYYIKHRYNPQLGISYTYYGRRTKKEADKIEQPLYGSNTMLPFDTEERAIDELVKLKQLQTIDDILNSIVDSDAGVDIKALIEAKIKALK